jgi:hypothetical protein
LVIKGESPNEASVTNFGKSLEFSSGLFTNLTIETQREEAKVDASAPGAAAAAPEDKDAPKPEVVAFTIRCTFAPASPTPAAAPGGQAAPANQVALK